MANYDFWKIKANNDELRNILMNELASYFDSQLSAWVDNKHNIEVEKILVNASKKYPTDIITLECNSYDRACIREMLNGEARLKDIDINYKYNFNIDVAPELVKATIEKLKTLDSVLIISDEKYELQYFPDITVVLSEVSACEWSITKKRNYIKATVKIQNGIFNDDTDDDLPF